MSWKENFTDSSPTGNWNVAGNYVTFKIMRHLYMIDDYELIASFGTSELVDEFQLNENQKKLIRIKAIKRFAKHLEMLISNTIFAIKIKKDKEDFRQYKQQVLMIKKALPLVETRTVNQKDKKVVVGIDEEKFEMVLSMLSKIKEEINEQLNRSDLIFTNIEEFDVDEIKKKLADDLVYGG